MVIYINVAEGLKEEDKEVTILFSTSTMTLENKIKPCLWQRTITWKEKREIGMSGDIWIEDQQRRKWM
jgi:hypothetical protein